MSLKITYLKLFFFTNLPGANELSHGYEISVLTPGIISCGADYAAIDF